MLTASIRDLSTNGADKRTFIVHATWDPTWSYMKRITRVAHHEYAHSDVQQLLIRNDRMDGVPDFLVVYGRHPPLPPSRPMESISLGSRRSYWCRSGSRPYGAGTTGTTGLSG